MARFLRWQLGSRLLRLPVLVPWVGSTSLVIETGMTGATMNLYCGLHEAADMAFVLHALRPGDVFLDVGTYTILASGVAQARTIALEPIPATFERLLRNLRLNDLLSRVDPHRRTRHHQPRLFPAPLSQPGKSPWRCRCCPAATPPPGRIAGSRHPRPAAHHGTGRPRTAVRRG